MQTALATMDAMDPETNTGRGDLDRLAEVAAALCGASMAFVAAFDRDTQWFRAQVGFDISSTPRGHSICETVFDAGCQVVIPDLLEDPRTRYNPVVIANGIRFYAGHPVRDAEGEIVGTVCVMDAEPRPGGLTEAQSNGIALLADQAATVFGLRRGVERHEADIRDHRMRAAHDRRRIARLSALVSLGDQLRDAATPEEAFGIAAETLGMTLGALQAGYAEVDDVAGVAIIRHDWTHDGLPSSSGHHRFEDHELIFRHLRTGRAMCAKDTLVNPEARQDLLSHMRVPIMANGHLVGIAYAIDEVDREWTPGDIEFARGMADRVHETIERMRVREAREVLVGEIGHRMKNLMAVTRAIAMQTLTGRVPAEVSKDLDERLASYSGAHDLLLAGGGQSAGLRETATAAADRLSVAHRISFEGPGIVLNERATLALSLLVNELVTNAIKHGSLSVAEGRVDMAWDVADGGMTITWREHGGPPATPPIRRGFGSRILQLGLHRVGGTSLDYSDKGLRATFTAPLHEIAAS
jgi:two-component sensor histidine kinase